MAARKPEAQVGEEREQLAAAAKRRAAREDGSTTTTELMMVQPTVKEYPPIVRKQADRLLRLFDLPEDHPGRNERIKEYQDALVRNGVEDPPLTLLDAQLFVEEIGEYHG